MASCLLLQIKELKMEFKKHFQLNSESISHNLTLNKNKLWHSYGLYVYKLRCGLDLILEEHFNIWWWHYRKSQM